MTREQNIGISLGEYSDLHLPTSPVSCPFITVCSGWIHHISGIIEFPWHHEYVHALHHLHQQGLVQCYLLAPLVLNSFHPLWCYSKRWFASLFRRRGNIPRVRDDVIPPLGLGYSAKADAGIGPIWILQAQGYTVPVLLIFLRIKKLLDIWIIFFMQFVPHYLFLYFINMQQSWAGQSKLHSKNKATAAQYHIISCRLQEAFQLLIISYSKLLVLSSEYCSLLRGHWVCSASGKFTAAQERYLLDIQLIWFGYMARLSQLAGGFYFI